MRMQSVRTSCCGCLLRRSCSFMRSADRLPSCRSLMAAYELLTLGFSNVNVLDGGMGAWKKSGRWASSCHDLAIANGCCNVRKVA